VENMKKASGRCTAVRCWHGTQAALFVFPLPASSQMKMSGASQEWSNLATVMGPFSLLWQVARLNALGKAPSPPPPQAKKSTLGDMGALTAGCFLWLPS
jgi:hypothetical protein